MREQNNMGDVKIINTKLRILGYPYILTNDYGIEILDIEIE